MTTTTTLPRRRRLALLLGLAVPLALPACSGGSDERAEVQSSADPAQQETGSTDASEPSDREAGTANDDGSTTTSKTSAEGSSVGGEDEVLASTTGGHPADPNDETVVPLRLDINRVERLPDDVIEIRFTLTNEGDTATYEMWRTLTDLDIGGYDVGGAALVDTVNDKRYLTLYDSENTCLCTGGDAELSAPPGESIQLYVQLTAPPAEVTEVGFTMPGFAPINGLALP